MNGDLMYQHYRRMVPQPGTLVVNDPEQLARMQQWGSPGDIWQASKGKRWDVAKNMGRLAINTGLDFLPGIGDVKSAQEAITGTLPMLEGLPGVESKLTGGERAVAALGALPFVPNMLGILKKTPDLGTISTMAKKGEGRIPATPGKAESGVWDESLYPKKWPNSDKKVKVAHFTDKEEFRFDPTAEPEPGRKGLFVYKLDELKPGQLEQLEREDWPGRWAEYIEVPESSLRDFQRFDDNEIPGRAGFTEYFIDSKEFPIPAGTSPKAEGGKMGRPKK